MNNEVILLTGEKQSGKTTFLEKWVEGRKDTAGILSPVRDDKRLFYDIKKKEYFEMESGDETIPGLAVGRYSFSAVAFDRVNNLLLGAVKDKTINYLVIDEIGPLETEQQKGLYLAFTSILAYRFWSLLIVVVRPSLTEKVCRLIAAYNKKAVVMTVNDLAEFLETGVSKTGS